MNRTELQVIYKDDHYVAINKPSGLLVHRTELAEQKGEFAMNLLRDQIGQHVFTCHRLDRPTSGALVFGLSADAGNRMQEMFARREVEKTYWAVVRGYAPDDGVIDKAVKSRYDKYAKEAETAYRTLERIELPIPVNKYPASRFSLVEASPKTGRTHQLRLHLRSLNCPIIGDTRYGDTRNNRLMENHFGNSRLLLHAKELKFVHPYTGESVLIEAELPQDYASVLQKTGLGMAIV